jgi:hypothetical protein
MERLRHKPGSDTSTQIFDLAGYILVTETKQEHGHTSLFALFDDVFHIIRHKHPEQTLCSFRDTYVLQSTISYLFSLFFFA